MIRARAVHHRYKGQIKIIMLRWGELCVKSNFYSNAIYWNRSDILWNNCRPDERSFSISNIIVYVEHIPQAIQIVLHLYCFSKRVLLQIIKCVYLGTLYKHKRFDPILVRLFEQKTKYNHYVTQQITYWYASKWNPSMFVKKL